MSDKYETQYTIVGEFGRSECEAEVRILIKAGWFPFGGVAVDRDYFCKHSQDRPRCWKRSRNP
jgi:hypothetical protein